MSTKLFSPELHKCYFLYIHKQICSKVPTLFVGPKHPFGYCYISCFLTDKTASNANRNVFFLSKKTNIFSKTQLQIENSGFVKTCDEYVLGRARDLSPPPGLNMIFINIFLLLKASFGSVSVSALKRKYCDNYLSQ